MFRISIRDGPDSLTFQLEGKLIGPWVREAEACWQQTLVGPRKPFLRLDLTGVTLIDAAGKSILAAAHAQGSELVASGSLMRAFATELTSTHVSGCKSS
jgi:hypothetical protein